MPEDKREEIIGTREELGEPGVFDFGVSHTGTVDVYGTVHGYFGDNLRIAGHILQTHKANRENIMERLKGLNPELHKVLTTW